MGYVVKLLVSVLLVAGLVHFLDIGSALRHLAAVEPVAAAAAMACYALAHVINAVKLRVMLPDRRVGTLLAFILVAQAYSLVLPGQLAGEAVKAYRLARTAAGHASRVVSSVAFDKMTSLVALLVTTFGGLVVEVQRFGSGLFVAVAAGLALLLGITGLLSLERVRGLAHGLRDGHGWRRWLSVQLWHFLDAWRTHARQPWSVAQSVFYGIAAQFAQAAGSVFLCWGLGLDVSFALWCVIIGALTVLLLAPVTIGGLGLREASLVGMLGLFGVGHDQALAVAFAILGFQLLVTVAGLLIDLLVLRGRAVPGSAIPDGPEPVTSSSANPATVTPPTAAPTTATR